MSLNDETSIGSNPTLSRGTLNVITNELHYWYTFSHDKQLAAALTHLYTLVNKMAFINKYSENL